MSEIKVNKISPKQTCTQLTLGDSGDTIIVTSGANFNTDAIKNLNTSSIITQTNATTITLGFSGSTIAIASGATQTGFGRTGTVNWDTTAKTANFTAVSGEGYFVNTTSGAIIVSLPAGVAGAIVSLADYTNTWQTNNVTITPNGSEKIGGVAASATLDTEGQSVTFVYVDATEGWKNIQDSTSNVTGSPFVAATGGTILTCGDFKTHVFTGPGTFTVTNAGAPDGSNSVEYLTVAGGGGAGACQYAGGGGGGYRQNYPSPTTAGLPVTATSYPITVGSGGAVGSRGSSSIFSTITSTGGGAGNGGASQPGGSGGGAAGEPEGGPLPVGTGNTPPVSPPQGNSGGPNTVGARRGGGGGGAGAAGGNAGGGNGSPIATTLFGPTSPSYGTPGPAPGRYFAGGGGGGTESTPGSPYAGGAGGGGPGGGNPSPGTPGTINTGGGGGSWSRGTGGGGSGTSGSGGSGIVVIRYKFQ
jgi:hypothetical protein